MMKNIFYLLFIPCILFAQEDSRQNPAVELPDFVITGKDVISVQQAKKMSADFVTTLSEEFFKPVFSPEELDMKDFSNPLKKEQNIFDSLNLANGHLDLKMGLYSLPDAYLHYFIPFTGGLVEGNFRGINERAHVDYSNSHGIEGGANIIYGIDSKESFFHGTRFKAGAQLGTNAYNFYGSVTPDLRRTYNSGQFDFRAENLAHDRLNIGFNLSNNYASLSGENFSENFVSIGGFARLSFPAFFIGGNIDYKRQYISNNMANSKVYDFLFARPVIGLNVSDIFKAMFGFTFSRSVGDNFVSPYASFGVKLDKSLSLFGEYSPGAEYYVNATFLEMNPYYDPHKLIYIFSETNTRIAASVKYEYDTYFQINGGVEISNSKNKPYFISSKQSGKFEVNTAETDQLYSYLNFLFYGGPFGYFYATAEYSDLKDSSGSKIPYSPDFRTSITYGYPFEMGLTAQTKLIFNSSSFTDIQNTNKIGSFVDLTLGLTYKLNNNFTLTFEVANILNHNNYIWNGYKESPLNFTGGFNFRW